MTDERKAKLAQQAIEGIQAMADYRAQTQASIDRIPQLRAARLARDTAPKSAKKKRKAQPAAGATSA